MDTNKSLSLGVFILINPITIGIYTFFISVFMWGPGIVAFGLTIFTGILSLISWGIFSIIKRPRDKNLRRIYMSISYVFIFTGWQSFQYYGVRGENLKSFLINNNIKNEFILQSSDVYFAGGEEEIWLQLESNKEAIKQLIASKEFERIEERGIEKPAYFPDWWPNRFKDYYCYEFRDRKKEEYYQILTSKDNKTVYYYYLFY